MSVFNVKSSNSVKNLAQIESSDTYTQIINGATFTCEANKIGKIVILDIHFEGEWASTETWVDAITIGEKYRPKRDEFVMTPVLSNATWYGNGIHVWRVNSSGIVSGDSSRKEQLSRNATLTYTVA